MYKKPLPKRKAKRVIKLLIFLFVIFLICTATLFILSFIFFKKPPVVITPIGIIENHKIVTTNQATASSSLQKVFDTYHLSIGTVIVGSDSATHIFLTNGSEIIFSKNKQLDNQIASLQLIINRLTIEGKSFARIDFRFDNPVISY